MKILAEAFAKDGDGHVRLVPETSDDMWHVFNLLRAGDRVEATTFRKVSKGAGGASHAADHGLGGHGGSGADTVRVRVKLRLDVESVEYAGDGEAVRVRGRNTTDTPHVKLGAYHTLEIDANRAVVIEKTLWDAADAKRLRELADPAASAEAWLVDTIWSHVDYGSAAEGGQVDDRGLLNPTEAAVLGDVRPFIYPSGTVAHSSRRSVACLSDPLASA